MVLFGLLALGCYRSHGLPTDGEEPPDAGARDMARPDLGSGCAVAIRDRDVTEWTELGGCGPVSAGDTIRRLGAFDQLARESPETCGRPPQLAARSVEVIGDDQLTFAAVEVLGALAPGARGLTGAAKSETLLVASGVEWTAFTSAYDPTDAGVLGRVPEPVPGCVFRLDAMDLVPLRSGWLVTFDYFECDVGGGQLRFYDDELTPLGEPMTRFPGVGAAVPLGDGALVVGKARPGVDTTLAFVEGPDSEPRTRMLATGGSAVAAARWSSLVDGIAVGFIEAGSVFRLRILDAEGAVLHRSDTALDDPRLELYQPIAVDLATTDFGVVAVVGFEWGGGRIDTASAILAFDRRARPLMEPEITADTGGGTSVVSVAGGGSHAVVTAFESTLERAVARTSLVSCLPD